ERARRKTRRIKNPELLADLPPLEVRRNLRFLLLREQTLIHRLERPVISRQLDQLRFTSRRRLDASLIAAEDLAQALFLLGFGGDVVLDAFELAGRDVEPGPALPFGGRQYFVRRDGSLRGLGLGRRPEVREFLARADDVRMRGLEMGFHLFEFVLRF